MFLSPNSERSSQHDQKSKDPNNYFQILETEVKSLPQKKIQLTLHYSCSLIYSRLIPTVIKTQQSVRNYKSQIIILRQNMSHPSLTDSPYWKKRKHPDPLLI